MGIIDRIQVRIANLRVEYQENHDKGYIKTGWKFLVGYVNY